MAKFNLKFLNIHSSTQDNSLVCLAQTISEYTNIQRAGSDNNTEPHCWQEIDNIQTNVSDGVWFLTHDNFCYSYNEKLSLHSNAQKELSFSMDRYIMRDDRREENPFIHNLMIGAYVLLTDKYDNQYLFVINKITYTFKNANIVYNYSCSDAFSYQLSKQNSGYSIENNIESADFLGAHDVDWWIKNKIHPECHIAYTYIPLEESLYMTAIGPTQEPEDNIIKIIKQGITKPPVNDDQGYFTKISFSGSGTANSLLIALGERAGLRLETFEYYNTNDKVLYRYYWLVPQKNSQISGLIYSPDTDIQSFGLNHSGNSLTTVLNVVGGSFDDEIVTMLPEVPGIFRDFFLSKAWLNSKYYPGMLLDICQHQQYTLESTSEEAFPSRIMASDVDTTQLENAWIGNQFIVTDTTTYFPLYYNSEDKKWIFNSFYTLWRLNNNSNSNYTYFNIVNTGGQSVVVRNNQYSMSLLLHRANEDYEVSANNALPDAIFTLDNNKQKEFQVFLKINYPIGQLSYYNIVLDLYRNATAEEVEFATIADDCPWLENKLIDFKYFYENQILNKQEYSNLLKLVQEDLRLVNGQLLVFSSQYYNALRDKTKKLAAITQGLDTLGARIQHELVTPAMFESGQKVDLDAVREAYNAIFMGSNSSTVALLDYGQTLSDYVNKAFSSEQRFLKNVNEFRKYFEAPVSFLDENYTLYNYSLTLTQSQNYLYSFGQLQLSLVDQDTDYDSYDIYYWLQDGQYNRMSHLVTPKNYQTYKIFDKTKVTEGNFLEITEDTAYDSTTQYYIKDEGTNEFKPLEAKDILARYKQLDNTQFRERISQNRIYIKSEPYIPVYESYTNIEDSAIQFKYHHTPNYQWLSIRAFEEFMCDTNLLDRDDQFSTDIWNLLSQTADGFTLSTSLLKCYCAYINYDLYYHGPNIDYKKEYGHDTTNLFTYSCYANQGVEEHEGDLVVKNLYLPLTMASAQNWDKLYKKYKRPFKSKIKLDVTDGYFNELQYQDLVTKSSFSNTKPLRYSIVGTNVPNTKDVVVDILSKNPDTTDRYPNLLYFTNSASAYVDMGVKLHIQNPSQYYVNYNQKQMIKPLSLDSKALKYNQFLKHLAFSFKNLHFIPSQKGYQLLRSEDYWLTRNDLQSFFYHTSFLQIVNKDDILNSNDKYLIYLCSCESLNNTSQDERDGYQPFDVNAEQFNCGFSYTYNGKTSWYVDATLQYPMLNIYEPITIQGGQTLEAWIQTQYNTDALTQWGEDESIENYIPLYTFETQQGNSFIVSIVKKVDYLPQPIYWDEANECYTYDSIKIYQDQDITADDYKRLQLNSTSTFYDVQNGGQQVNFYKDYTDIVKGLYILAKPNDEVLTPATEYSDDIEYFYHDKDKYTRVYTKPQLKNLDNIYYLNGNTYHDSSCIKEDTFQVPVYIYNTDLTLISNHMIEVKPQGNTWTANYRDAEKQLNLILNGSYECNEEALSDFNNGGFWYRFHDDLTHQLLMEYAVNIEATLTEYWTSAYNASLNCQYFLPEYWQKDINQNTNNFAVEIWSVDGPKAHIINTFLPTVDIITDQDKYVFKFAMDAAQAEIQEAQIANDNNIYSITDIAANNQAIQDFFNRLNLIQSNYWYAYTQYAHYNYYTTVGGGTKWNSLLPALNLQTEMPNLSGWYEMMVKVLLQSNYKELQLNGYYKTLQKHNEIWDKIYKMYPGIVLEQSYSNTDAISSTVLYQMAKLAFKDMKELETGYNLSLIDISHLKNYIGQEIKIGDSIQIDADAYYDEYDYLKRSLQQLLYVTDITYSLRSDKDINVTVNTIKYQDKVIRQLVNLIR